MSLVLRKNPFDTFAKDFFNFGSIGRTIEFAPAFEAKETPDAFVITADVPGVDEENIDISAHEGILRISGRRDAEQRKDGEAYTIYERRYGEFIRSFRLPDNIDAERIEAKLANGVLTVTIGKMPEAKPRKILLKSS